MFDLLRGFCAPPSPFCRYTAPSLWTRPHIAKQMLKFHLASDSNLASRRPDRIAKTVERLDNEIGLKGKKVCDLGCGPGLYAQLMARYGAHVTGLDISTNSLDYARQAAAASKLNIRYENANYLDDPLPNNQDLFCLIYADFGVLSPSQRAALLQKIRSSLKPGGSVMLDVFTDKLFAEREQSLQIEENMMDGFWAEAPYMGIKRSWLYSGKLLSLDHYLIIDENESFEIFNWLQHFTPLGLIDEVQQAGFKVTGLMDIEDASKIDLSQSVNYGHELGIIATPA